MNGFKVSSWLSLILLLIAYTVFGRYMATLTPIVSHWLGHHGTPWGWSIDHERAVGLLSILGVIFVFALVLLLATPLALTKVIVGNSLTSEKRALYTFLAWSLAAVFFFRWLHYTLQFLILICATILGRLELQYIFRQKWLVFVTLMAICLTGFAIGMLTLNYNFNFFPSTGHV